MRDPIVGVSTAFWEMKCDILGPSHVAAPCRTFDAFF